MSNLILNFNIVALIIAELHLDRYSLTLGGSVHVGVWKGGKNASVGRVVWVV